MAQFFPIPAAGGGASFIFDGATFTVGSFNSEDLHWPILLELTSGGVLISQPALIHAAVYYDIPATGEKGFFSGSTLAYLNDNTGAQLTSKIQDAEYDVGSYTSYLIRYQHDVTMNYLLKLGADVTGGTPATEFRFSMWISLPNGSIASSGYMLYTVPTPP